MISVLKMYIPMMICMTYFQIFIIEGYSFENFLLAALFMATVVITQYEVRKELKND